MAIDANGNWYPKLPDSPDPAYGWGDVLAGPGVPPSDVGRNGDVWTNVTNGDVYIRYGDAWVIMQGAAGGSGEAGSGSPEGVVTATPGTTYVDVLNHALWIKESGSGNTGWTLFI